MIVSSLDGADRTVMISQTDHARFAAEFLSLWRTDGLPRHPLRDELIFAAREHDNGWAEIDSAPMVDGNGNPYDFISMPTPVRQEIWNRGIRRHAESRPAAALWITLHALHLHRGHGDDEEWRETLESWRRTEQQLRREVGLPDETVDDGYAFIELADTVSLAACARWSRASRLRGMEIRPLAGDPSFHAQIALDPFPLAGSTVFEVAARSLDRQTFSGDTDLALALAGTRWTKVRIRITPGPGPGIR